MLGVSIRVAYNDYMSGPGCAVMSDFIDKNTYGMYLHSSALRYHVERIECVLDRPQIPPGERRGEGENEEHYERAPDAFHTDHHEGRRIVDGHHLLLKNILAALPC